MGHGPARDAGRWRRLLGTSAVAQVGWIVCLQLVELVLEVLGRRAGQVVGGVEE